MEAAPDAAREALKRKREQKEAQKEEKKKKKDVKNLSSAPNHVAALLVELNALAEQEPEFDKHGKPVNFYFYTEHNEGDLDCFGDLKYLSRNDIKKAMRFTEDDLLFASNLKMLVTRRECTNIAGRKTLTEPLTWLIEPNKL